MARFRATQSVLRYHPISSIFVIAVMLFSSAVLVHAQGGPGSFTFTVTPPLIQVALAPGETWSTSIQVVNQNPYEVSIVAEPVLFRSGGESGRPVFIRTAADSGEPIAHDRSVIAGWITVPQEPVRVAPEQTYVLPLSITVPQDAPPGGHYAAILIGNAPSTVQGENTIAVSSSIASLFMLRVAGDVVESGRIREFSIERTLYGRPEATLTLRFENKGNVHLQPQGEIRIYNMWGNKRGSIQVNPGAGYGNVLPGSVREFVYTWEADTGVWDIGRYRATASLGYGEEAVSFADSTVYFWVLPIVPFFEILAALVVVGWILLWGVRVYIRRALALEARAIEHTTQPSPADTAQVIPPTPRLTVRALARPITHSMLDLRAASHSDSAEVVPSTTSVNTPLRARMASVVRMVLVIGAVLISAVFIQGYVRDVTTEERPYTLEEVRTDARPPSFENVNQ